MSEQRRYTDSVDRGLRYAIADMEFLAKGGDHPTLCDGTPINTPNEKQVREDAANAAAWLRYQRVKRGEA